MIHSIIRLVKMYIKHMVTLPKFFWAEHYLRKLKKNKDTIYIVCPFGIGDTLFIATLVKNYKQHYGIKRVGIIVKENHRDLPDFFDEIDEKIVSSKIVENLRWYACKYRVFHRDNFRYGHFLLPDWPEPGQLLGLKNVSLIDIYRRCVLRIPDDAKIQYPEIYISKHEMEEYQEKFGALDKVVLLMPYAVTVNRISMEFWEELAKYCKKNEYQVYTNVKDQSETPIQGTEAMCLSLKELFLISRIFRWKCIALRSGICDLLGFSDIELIVIHENSVLKNAWSMKELGLPNKRIKDVVMLGNASVKENVKYIFNNMEDED